MMKMEIVLSKIKKISISKIKTLTKNNDLQRVQSVKMKVIGDKLMQSAPKRTDKIIAYVTILHLFAS